MALNKLTYVDNVTVIPASNLNAIQDEIIANASSLTTKADKSTTYTKTEVDGFIAEVEDGAVKEDGTYPDLTSGSSEALLSDSYTLDTEPYVYRQGVGARAYVDEIVGGSVGWNQLCNGSSVTVPSGHKSYVLKSGTATISNATSITGLTSGTDMVIDFTALFGTTVADYLYQLEQSTAGAGVKLFKQMFPKSYYPYNAGSLLSVKTSGRKTVGKNLIPYPYAETTKTASGVTFTDNGDGTLTLNGTSTATVDFILYPYSGGMDLPIGDYVVTMDGLPSGCPFIIGGGTVAYSQVYDWMMPYSFSVSNSGSVGYGILRIPSGTSLNNVTIKPMIRPASVTNGTYAPYTSHTYPMSNIDLRGVFKLADGKIYCDGDVYRFDGKVIRNYSTRAYQSGDESLADAITDGTTTVYKLTTPTTESAEPYQHLQFSGSTEAFTGSEIPVGHSTRYLDDLKAKIEGLPWDLSMIAPIESGTTSSKAYAVGEYFLLNNQFCKAKTSIASGATFTLNTNYTVTTIGAELKSLA